jgi:hypothetical protein
LGLHQAVSALNRVGANHVDLVLWTGFDVLAEV